MQWVDVEGAIFFGNEEPLGPDYVRDGLIVRGQSRFDSLRGYFNKIYRTSLFHVKEVRLENEAMWYGLWYKFVQNPFLLEILQHTGHDLLVYRNLDAVWGCGENGEGENRLGLMLMYLRKFLCGKEYVAREVKIKLEFGFSASGVVTNLSPTKDYVLPPLCPYKGQNRAMDYFRITQESVEGKPPRLVAASSRRLSYSQH